MQGGGTAHFHSLRWSCSGSLSPILPSALLLTGGPSQDCRVFADIVCNFNVKSFSHEWFCLHGCLCTPEHDPVKDRGGCVIPGTGVRSSCKPPCGR